MAKKKAIEEQPEEIQVAPEKAQESLDTRLLLDDRYVLVSRGRGLSPNPGFPSQFVMTMAEAIPKMLGSGFMKEFFADCLVKAMEKGQKFQSPWNDFSIVSQAEVTSMLQSGAISSLNSPFADQRAKRNTKASQRMYHFVGGKETYEKLPRQAFIMAEFLISKKGQTLNEETIGAMMGQLFKEGKLKTKLDPLRVFKSYVKNYQESGFLDVIDAETDGDSGEEEEEA